MTATNPIRAAAAAAGFKLSASQARLLDYLRNGKTFAGPTSGKRAPRIDARLIRWLCSTREIAPYVHAHGLNLSHVTIWGELDLNFVRCDFPITMEHCRLPQPCMLRFANFPFLCFIDCEFDELEADRLTVAQSLLLTGSTFAKELLLRGAVIGGNLGLNKTRLRAAGAWGLTVEGATVGGSMWMMGIRAEAAIRIYGAEIKRNLESNGIVTARRSRVALVVESSRIGGAILLRSGFRALGQVRIVGCSVHGTIDLQGARLTAFGDVALLIEGVKASGSIFMRDDGAAPYKPFRCIGGVSLLGTTTEGDVDFTGAIITAARRPALNLHGVKCEGQLLGQGAQIRGWLVLAGATVKSNVSLAGAIIGDGSGFAILGRSHHCGGSLHLRGATVRGTAQFQNLFVGDDLVAWEAGFEGTDGDALILSSGRIRGAADFGETRFAGPLNIDHCTIGTRLNLRGASLVGFRAGGCTIGADLALIDATIAQAAGRPSAAQLDGLRCQGWLLLGDKFVCEGMFDFSRSVLGGLDGHGARFSGAPRAIDGAFAQVQGEVQLPDSVIKGGVRLARASVAGSLDLSGCSLAAGDDVALDLSGARIGETLFLTGGFEVGAGEVRLSNADVATLRDDPEHWLPPARVDIQGLTYRNIAPLEVKSRVAWLSRWRPIERERDGGGSWQPYEQLMETLRRHGRERDRKKVAIAKQKAVAHANPSRLVRALYAVYGLTIGYGYQPQRALVFAPVFIGFSILIFLTGADTLMVPANEPVRAQWARTHVLPAGYPSFNAVAYSFDSFVPILSLQQRDSWRPNDRETCRRGPEHCGSLLRILLWVNTAVGWIVTTLVVAGFTGLIRRD